MLRYVHRLKIYYFKNNSVQLFTKLVKNIDIMILSAMSMSPPELDSPLNTSLLPNLTGSVSPPPQLFTMMGVWASLTGLLGVTANILAIGVFIRVKRVINRLTF